MKEVKTEKFWDRLANRFDKQTKYFESPPIEQAKKHLKESDIVLDFGCATGTVTVEIAGCVKEITGIDISSKMVDAAKRKADERNISNIDFKHATLFDEGFKNKSLDVILAFNILHFFKDTAKVLQRMHGLLNSEGLLIIATTCLGQRTFSNGLQFLLFSLLMKTNVIPYMKFFKISELKDLLGQAGFQIIVVENLKSPTDYFVVAKKVLKQESIVGHPIQWMK